MRIGLVGTGPWAGMAHGPGLVQAAGVDLVGVWGRRPEEAGRLAATLDTTAYDAFVREVNPYGDELFDEHGADDPAVSGLIRDPANLAVYTSFWDPHGVDEDASEGCLYYDVYVLRANGTGIRLTFDYTD